MCARLKLGDNMKSVKNKDSKSQKIIEEEKIKIKAAKKRIKEIKNEKFKKTKLYKQMNKIRKFVISDKDNYTFSEVLIVTILSIILGAFACYATASILCGSTKFINVSKETRKFNEAYQTLIDNYYGELDKEDLIEGAISGMMNSIGDTYTTYSNSSTTEAFNELVGGTYEGIGATIQETDNGILVIDTYQDSPAEKAGLKVGDIILTADEIDATKTSANELSTYIKNKTTKNVMLKIKRNDEEQVIELKRDKVEIPVVDTEIYEVNNKKIGYISISVFSSVASNQFAEKLKKLEQQNIDGLVIDVRDNNGGYLTTVVDVASQLLPKGKTIYQLEKGEEKTSYKDKTKQSRKYPIAILVNGNSASASEILAAAIKESYNGFVVGTQTYGKGTVQQVKTLSDGSMLKYTVENWLSPKGIWINGTGVTPTHVIELSEEYFQESISTNDNQLNKALELVSK